MSVVAAALLLQPVPVLVQPALPPSPPPTAQSATRPGFDLDCSLVDPRMERRSLRLEQRGGRGFEDPRQDHSQRRFRSTRLTFRIIEDETGLFGGSAGLIGENDGFRLTRVEGSHPTAGAVRLDTAYAGRDLWAATVSVNALAEISHTGFCRVARHAQTPLTAAEAAEQLRR
jgi:hypothetical protein